jgi:hypothetical protein
VTIHHSTPVLNAPSEPPAPGEPGHWPGYIGSEDPDGSALAGGLQARSVFGPDKVRCIRVRSAGTYVVEPSRSLHLVALREQA